MTLTLPSPAGRTTEKRIGIVTGVSPVLRRNLVIVPLAGAWTPLFQNSLSSRQLPRIGTGSPVRLLPHVTLALSVARESAPRPPAAGAATEETATAPRARKGRIRGEGRIGRGYLRLTRRRVKSQARLVATAAGSEITLEELQLAARNHALPLEALHHPITPIGLHYLLIHFDIPVVDPVTWRLEIGGRVRRPLTLELSDIQSRPARTLPVTLECAGNGRALMAPRSLSQPWLNEAVGTAEWTGTPLAPLLEEAGIDDGALEVVFTGLDRGVQSGVEHLYERSLPLAEALREEVLLAWAINGLALPPQHGYPLRLIVPGWYGMTHVKWLRSVTVVDEAFQGWQQQVSYHLKDSEDDPGVPATRIRPRALMVPPGDPDFLTRERFLP